jgi:hypothetical protein
MGKRIWIVAGGLAATVVVFGGVTVLGWMLNETQFDRQSEDFDRLTAQIETLPGVSVDDKKRWVEAPTFSGPSSRIGLTVDEAHLPRLLEAACAGEYPETVSWSFRIETEEDNAVFVHGDSTPADASGGSECLDFGFDAVGFVGEVDSIVPGGRPGLDLQPTVWDGQFAIIELGERVGGISTLLPLVAHAEGLRDAAGVDSDRSVEINANNLSLIIDPGEQDRYSEFLSDLVGGHGVESYWADGGGTQIDGVEKVQIVAPDEEHGAIEEAIRESGLHVAGLPVRFIPLPS